MKKYVIISGFNTSDNNRGTAALSYGAINFCIQKNYLRDGQELINFRYIKKIWKKEYQDYTEDYHAEGRRWTRHCIHVFFAEKWLYDKFHILLPFTKFGRTVRNTELVAAINGGDGFSDIYNTQSFLGRLSDINIAMREDIHLVILPQTIGPFNLTENKVVAHNILMHASRIFVRDNKYTDELDRLGLHYEITKDLSAFMEPEPWDIEIEPGSIGINISGLCFSNKFRTLSGQFETYPRLIKEIIGHFQQKNRTIYLIPHSYNQHRPVEGNDDMVACREAYNSLEDKTNVHLISNNLSSPQVKYVISKMSFFIGTRMHANFAAIYTGVPVFALSYSYKFAGAFNANGLDGEKQTFQINNLPKEEIETVISKIEAVISRTEAVINNNEK